MKRLMQIVFRQLIVVFMALIAGCGQSEGPDSISSHKPFAGGQVSSCDCHTDPLGTSRQVLGAGGDFALNPNITSHHVAGAGDPTGEQCLVCHDLTQHGSGIVLLRDADTGASIAYISSANMETFCLKCHDSDGAANTFVAGGSALNPFNDGSTLGIPPYSYATRIASSWAKSFGHGPSGNHSAGSKLTCLGSGAPGTGCHGSNGAINAHGSVKQVLAGRSFRYDNDNFYNAEDFTLCFDCHASYPGFTKEDILGVKQGGILDWEYYMSPFGGQGPNGWNPPYYISAVQTHFADHNEVGSPYNDPAPWGENMNLHWAHIGLPISDFRGTGATTGINCVSCHDVHGSSTIFGALYDEIGYSHEFPDAINILGKMTDGSYLSTQLEGYPTYCAFNCHSVIGQSRAWFYPITE